LKECTIRWKYEREKESRKGQPHLSAQKVCDLVNRLRGTTITKTMLIRYTNNDMVGESPLKRGPKGWLPAGVYKIAMTAFATHKQLCQIEAVKTPKAKDMVAIVERAFLCSAQRAKDMASRLRKDTAHIFSAGKAGHQEARRILFTTFHNLNMWFDSWEEMIISLGFGRRKTEDDTDVEGSIVYFDPDRIINLDETRISLDTATWGCLHASWV